jgi:SM-20-related protein
MGQPTTSSDLEGMFSALGDQLAQQNYGILDHYLSQDECTQLRSHLLWLYEEGKMKKAGIGTSFQFQVDASIRGDYILWIETHQPDSQTSALVERTQSLMQFFNRYFYLGLRDVEMHFAVYPAGAGYQRHTDQLQQNNHRILSMVLYLNENWQTGDGGQLRIFLPENEHLDGVDHYLDVDPIGGRLVCFRSDLIEHEVMPTNRERMSITGWMLDQPIGLTFL